MDGQIPVDHDGVVTCFLEVLDSATGHHRPFGTEVSRCRRILMMSRQRISGGRSG